LEELKTINPARIVYVDECGLNESIGREYARAVKGKPVVTNILGKRTARTSIIAGLNAGKPVAPMYFEGYCNTDVVKQWVKDVLTPVLIPGQVVIWDNASFHQCTEFSQLIESAGCRLIYLPTYSPDLNPIEQWWSALKARIRRLRKWAKLTIGEALEYLLKYTH
jgi:transposase